MIHISLEKRKKKKAINSIIQLIFVCIIMCAKSYFLFVTVVTMIEIKLNYT